MTCMHACGPAVNPQQREMHHQIGMNQLLKVSKDGFQLIMSEVDPIESFCGVVSRHYLAVYGAELQLNQVLNHLLELCWEKWQKLCYLPPKCDVFLGGVCNPTTWRKDHAIPFLDEAKMTYFNPQVENWHPSLIELEREFKQNSLVLFWVFEKWSTRGLASLMEAVFLIARGAYVVLVILDKQSSDKPLVIDGEEVSTSELEYLNKALEYLKEIADKNEIPIFDDLHKALAYTRQRVFEFKTRPLTISRTEVMCAMVWNKLRSTHNQSIPSEVSRESVENHSTDFELLENGDCKSVMLRDMKYKLFRSSVEDPTRIKQLKVTTPIPVDLLININELDYKHFLEYSNVDFIKSLDKYNLSYKFDENPSNSRYIAHLMLFLLDVNYLTMNKILEAIYLIGLGFPAVLSVRNLLNTDSSTTNCNGLSKSEPGTFSRLQNDYRRAYQYLISLAKEQKVLIFDEPISAFSYCIDQLRNHTSRPQNLIS